MLPMHCIICLRKVSCIANVQNDTVKITAATRSVVEAPGFLKTFNEIWESLQKRRKDDNSDIGTDAGITVTTVVTNGEGLNSTMDGDDGTFREAPTICQICCDKVVSVENLMKAVRQQVREIKMLYEHCRRKKDKFSVVRGDGEEEEEYIPENIKSQTEQSELDDDDIADVQIKQDDWYWQEPEPVPNIITKQVSSASFNSQIKTTFISEASDNETPMEYDDNDQGGDDDDIKSEDPDYIKSEEESGEEDEESSEGDDDDDDDEEEKQEKMITLKNKFVDQYTTSPDPLANNSMTTFTTDDFTKTGGKRVREAPQSSLENDGSFICKMLGCGRQFKNDRGLLLHTRKLHRGDTHKPKKRFPCDVPGCPKTFSSADYIPKHKRKRHPSSLTPTFICDLVEDCNHSCFTKASLKTHQKTSHPEIFSKLSIKKYVCTCGLKFHSHHARYLHKRKNPTQHPEQKPDLVRNGNGQKCDLCDEQISYLDLTAHYKEHLGGSVEYLVKCPNTKCLQIFLTPAGLQAHFTKEKNCNKMGKEKKSGLICETCGFTTDQKLTLKNHVESVHELLGGAPREIKCPISGCNKMFSMKQSIYFHLSTHRTKKISWQRCDKCGEKICLEGMEEHLKEEHGVVEMFGCKKCGFKFSGRYELVEHWGEHRPLEICCDVCNNEVKYTRYSDFREHYFGSHGLCPKRYGCEECGVDFWLKKNNYQHNQIHHNGKDKDDKVREEEEKKDKKKKFKCDMCGEKGGNVGFANQLDLISHKIRAHGMDPFRCEICGRTFNDKGVWSRHMKEHAGVEFKRDWRCEVDGCGKVFTTKQMWKRHVKFGHGGEGMPNICDICGKGFSLAGGLKKHRESVHLGLRPWICEECGEGFVSVTVLKRHKLIHTGERPFACEICGQRFRHKEVLRRHVIGHEEKGKDFKPNGPMKQIRKRKAL